MTAPTGMLEQPTETSETPIARPSSGRLSPATLVSFAVCLWAAFGSMRPSPDPDTWWHLATGRWILDHARIPTSDPFSWTAAGKGWVAHEWGAQALLSWMDDLFGPAGLLVFSGLMIGLAFLLLRRTLRRVTDNEWAVTGALGLAVYLSTLMWSVRPHVVSILLIVFYLDSLVSARLEGNYRRLYWLSPLTLVWANLHAVFVSGVLLIWVFTAFAIVERRRDWRRWLMTAGFATVAGAVNPAGPGIYLFSVYLARVSERIQEWAPPGIRTPRDLIFVSSVLVALVAAGMVRRRPDRALVGIAAFFGLLGLGAVRNIWIGGIMVAPCIAWCVAQVLPAARPAKAAVERRFLNAGHVVFVVLGIAFAFTTLAGRSDAFLRAEGPFPRAAAEHLATLPEGRLLNPYNWGGYLIWKLPSVPVSVDPRADMYGDELLPDLLDLESLTPGWNQFIEERDVDYVLWQADGRLAEGLRLLDNWRIVYEDDEAVIFERARGG